jgi:putative N6-adenine-specific DNA methylase
LFDNITLVYWKSSRVSLHHNRLWQSTISSAESEDNVKNANLDEYIKIEEKTFDTEKTRRKLHMVSIRLMMSV